MNQEKSIELEAIKASAQSILDRVNALLGESTGEDTSKLGWYDTRTLVLARVMEKGEIVTMEEWKAIGNEFNFDPRGLGGFFTGKKPSMVTVVGNKKAITEEGARSVRKWIRENPDLVREYNITLDLEEG